MSSSVSYDNEINRSQRIVMLTNVTDRLLFFSFVLFSNDYFLQYVFFGFLFVFVKNRSNKRTNLWGIWMIVYMFSASTHLGWWVQVIINVLFVCICLDEKKLICICPKIDYSSWEMSLFLFDVTIHITQSLWNMILGISLSSCVLFGMFYMLRNSLGDFEEEKWTERCFCVWLMEPDIAVDYCFFWTKEDSIFIKQQSCDREFILLFEYGNI